MSSRGSKVQCADSVTSRLLLGLCLECFSACRGDLIVCNHHLSPSQKLQVVRLNHTQAADAAVTAVYLCPYRYISFATHKHTSFDHK